MNDLRPVIAGVDGSPSSNAAASYAAALAERRQAPLHLIHGYQQALYSWAITGVPWPEEASDEQIRSEIEHELRALVERLRREHPHLVAVQARQIHSTAASVLIRQSEDAQVTVVGSRGIGGFSELLLGSVSWQVASHAHGPVIVVRPPIADHIIQPGPEQPPPRPKPLGPIMIAYDGSPGADAALDFAVTEALQRNVRLIATNVHSYAQDEAQQMLTDAIKPHAAAHPALDVELRTIASDDTGHALVEATRDVALTVVGSRGLGGFTGLLLGSISRTLVHHAYGPVAVIHPPSGG
jgi:nucleotide-binding universal stress UspA family protein